MLTALRVRAIGDSGPYASVGMKVLERAAGHASGPYHVPAIDVHATAVRTNNPVCGAFRGFGANQAQFAMDGVLDRMAEMVGISGWEIRKRNVIKPGQVWGPGQIMDDGAAGAEACLDAMRPLYDEARAQGRAIGIGLGLKNSGLGNGFREISQGSRAVPRPAGASRFVTGGPRWARACTPSRCKWLLKSWASTRRASTSSSTPRASSASGRPPDRAAR